MLAKIKNPFANAPNWSGGQAAQNTVNIDPFTNTVMSGGTTAYPTTTVTYPYPQTSWPTSDPTIHVSYDPPSGFQEEVRTLIRLFQHYGPYLEQLAKVYDAMRIEEEAANGKQP